MAKHIQFDVLLRKVIYFNGHLVNKNSPVSCFNTVGAVLYMLLCYVLSLRFNVFLVPASVPRLV